MNATPVNPVAGLTALLLAFFVVGCNASGVTENEENEANEVRVTVQALGSDYVDADDGIRYEVTPDTQYEGLGGLSDVSVGDTVDIEFEEIANSTNRRAVEIEANGAGNG